MPGPLILLATANHEKAPASAVIEYNAQIYSPSLLGDPEYFGVPSARIDDNWNLLLERMPQTIVIPIIMSHYAVQHLQFT
jgi:hypothetical protein